MPAACLLHFLLQMAEQLGMKKFLDGDVQPVAQLLDGGDRGAPVAPADDVVHGGLGDAAAVAEGIHREVPFPAQLQNAPAHGFSDCHGRHLFSSEMIPVSP